MPSRAAGRADLGLYGTGPRHFAPLLGITEPVSTNAVERFDGTNIIVAPHMGPPAPVMPWRNSITADLGKLRMRESMAATGLLGISEENLQFLGLPEKRAALACFKTKRTRFYPWQTRPILTGTLLDEECVGPEILLRVAPQTAGPAVFSDTTTWIRIARRLELRLQKWKYQVKSTLLRSIQRAGIGSD